MTKSTRLIIHYQYVHCNNTFSLNTYSIIYKDANKLYKQGTIVWTEGNKACGPIKKPTCYLCYLVPTLLAQICFTAILNLSNPIIFWHCFMRSDDSIFFLPSIVLIRELKNLV